MSILSNKSFIIPPENIFHMFSHQCLVQKLWLLDTLLCSSHSWLFYFRGLFLRDWLCVCYYRLFVLRLNVFLIPLNTVRLLDVILYEVKLYLVFEYLNLDLKKYMDSITTAGLPGPLVKVCIEQQQTLLLTSYLSSFVLML